MKKRRSKIPPKPLIGLISLFLILFFSAVLLKVLARNSDFFRVKEIIIRDEVVRPDKKIDLSYFKGSNIFTVNLGREEDYLSRSFPGYQKIKLVKIFPDKIFADFIKRKPVACVKLYRYFYLDQDMVLYGAPSEADLLGLPIIFGLETKLFGPKQGIKYNIKELAIAFNIIKAVRFNKALEDFQIKKINVADGANTSFFMAQPAKLPGNTKLKHEVKAVNEGLEVKIGQDYIADKINILSSLMMEETNDWDNIKYIDLRFKDPVIKFKNMKDSGGNHF